MEMQGALTMQITDYDMIEPCVLICSMWGGKMNVLRRGQSYHFYMLAVRRNVAQALSGRFQSQDVIGNPNVNERRAE